LEEALIEQIVLAHRERPIDLFFTYFYSMNASPATIEQIRRMGIVTVNWYCNASYQFHLVEEIAPAYDYCLVPEKFRLDDYRRIGANPIYCQEAANPNIYKPHDLPTKFDVTFVGQKYGNRPVYIRHLLDQGIDVHVWGPFWQRGPRSVPRWRLIGSRIKRFLKGAEPLFPVKIPRKRCGPPLDDQDLIKMYSRSRINLGFSSVADTTTGIKQVRLRDFEVPMSGGFYMIEYMSELEEFFEIGQEVVCYHDKDDLAAKVQYYLAHDSERERIRKAGMRRARRDHTWHRRFQDCFAQMDLA
jgi:spore maturation protein CgeB